MKPASRAFGLAAGMIAAAAACDSGTGGALVEVALTSGNVAEGAAPLGVFTTDTGWSVVLSEAKLVIGSVYAFAPDPDALAPIAALLGPSVARAHGGVDPLSGRVVRAQWLEPFVVDALSPTPVDHGAVEAEAGEVDALELRLLPPSAALAAQTHGHHAYFAGTATKDSVSIDFEGGVDVPERGTARRVEGVAIDDRLDEGGALELALHAPTFFRGVFFDALPPEDPQSGARPLAPGSQPYAAIELGLRNPAAYSTSYVAGGAP